MAYVIRFESSRATHDRRGWKGGGCIALHGPNYLRAARDLGQAHIRDLRGEARADEQHADTEVMTKMLLV